MATSAGLGQLKKVRQADPTPQAAYIGKESGCGVIGLALVTCGREASQDDRESGKHQEDDEGGQKGVPQPSPGAAIQGREGVSCASLPMADGQRCYKSANE